jgi:hypothetical protein
MWLALLHILRHQPNVHNLVGIILVDVSIQGKSIDLTDQFDIGLRPRSDSNASRDPMPVLPSGHLSCQVQRAIPARCQLTPTRHRLCLLCPASSETYEIRQSSVPLEIWFRKS